MKQMTYHERLKQQMDAYVHLIYKLTKTFPEDERYGVTSQLRRAALSVILNYIEGYARGGGKIYKNFLEISFGSLKESSYLLDFSLAEHYIFQEQYKIAKDLAEEIGAMLWGTMKHLE